MPIHPLPPVVEGGRGRGGWTPPTPFYAWGSGHILGSGGRKSNPQPPRMKWVRGVPPMGGNHPGAHKIKNEMHPPGSILLGGVWCGDAGRVGVGVG